MKHIISLGAGVQSSAMALMAARGEITPMPECAIFADTGWEPKAVYDWLHGFLIQELPFPVHIVTGGNIRHDQVTARVRGIAVNGERFASLPYFVSVENQDTEGRIRRQCTKEYKIDPITKYIKSEIMGLKPRQRAPKEPVINQWRGITTDEAGRMKDSTERWMVVRYPLALEHQMTRYDCKAWMARHGYPEPPRSACIGCPFHSNYEWRRMRDHAPEEWKDACEFDAAIRKGGGMRGDSFLHRSLKPLAEVDLDTEEDRGQIDMFNNECEGMCGV